MLNYEGTVKRRDEAFISFVGVDLKVHRMSLTEPKPELLRLMPINMREALELDHGPR